MFRRTFLGRILGVVGGSSLIGLVPKRVEPSPLSSGLIGHIPFDGTNDYLHVEPIIFDDAIITSALLHGELYPLVTVERTH